MIKNFYKNISVYLIKLIKIFNNISQYFTYIYDSIYNDLLIQNIIELFIN